MYVIIKEFTDYTDYTYPPSGGKDSLHQVLIKEYDEHNGTTYLLKSNSNKSTAINFFCKPPILDPPDKLTRLYVDPSFDLKESIEEYFAGYVWINERDATELHSNKDAKQLLLRR